ncbi:MAG: flagellar hook-basal body complex protein FliE [Xylanivirga thermophila]|uniref:flagellar hook-basal body complex protein FliE n=1 Tax=Xylanivirga thermophila TaxID=2496273 RepID=UPI0039F57F64
MRIDDISLQNSTKWSVGRGEKIANITSFKDMLGQAVGELKALQSTDYQNSNLLSTGQIDSLHKVMIDAEKADIALQFTVQVRNKVIEAYQEIMRMQL